MTRTCLINVTNVKVSFRALKTDIVKFENKWNQSKLSNCINIIFTVDINIIKSVKEKKSKKILHKWEFEYFSKQTHKFLSMHNNSKITIQPPAHQFTFCKNEGCVLWKQSVTLVKNVYWFPGYVY